MLPLPGASPSHREIELTSSCVRCHLCHHPHMWLPSSTVKASREGDVPYYHSPGKETEAQCGHVANKRENHEANRACGYSSLSLCSGHGDIVLALFMCLPALPSHIPPSAAPEGEAGGGAAVRSALGTGL